MKFLKFKYKNIYNLRYKIKIIKNKFMKNIDKVIKKLKLGISKNKKNEKLKKIEIKKCLINHHVLF